MLTVRLESTQTLSLSVESSGWQSICKALRKNTGRQLEKLLVNVDDSTLIDSNRVELCRFQLSHLAGS